MSISSEKSDAGEFVSLKRQFVLQAESPLAVLQSRTSAQFVKSLDYLPGSAVRGAFAEIFLNKIGSEAPVFQEIFVQQKIRFHDFLPTFGSEPPVLLPLSARACKRHKLEHPESLCDALVEIMATGKSEERLCPSRDDGNENRECKGNLDRINGYVQMQNNKVESIAPQRQLRMHVGISRLRGAAQHGQLFSYDMLTEKHLENKARKNSKFEDEAATEKKLAFVGVLEGVTEDTARLFEELDKMTPSDREHLSVGKARTRGLGELSFKARSDLPPNQDFDERWRAFNGAVQSLNASDEYCYFAITLKSHLILHDALGRPILDEIDATHLEDESILNESERIDGAVFLNRVTVSGWNAAQGLPKPDVPALARGGVIGFRARIENEEALKQELQKLERSGLGERRAEGFGQIVVCDPFHVNYA